METQQNVETAPGAATSQVKSRTATTDSAGPAQNGASAAGHGFGTLPVFMAGISTILGAIMFLRFGYAVGNVGLLGAFGIILLGHLVTIPTALALAEIATNRKVEGGGEYFIISRSFGPTIGSVIGISLYLSQAVSVAFYMIAFAEAFSPFSGWFQANIGFYDPRIISLPATALLLGLVLFKGAALGVRALYVVVVTLVASLIMFFLGGTIDGFEPTSLQLTTSGGDGFFIVFAICFPAFTGMTAGVGLSGDLADPKRSIPMGTMAATLVGMIVYVAIVIKLAASAPAEALRSDQLIMSQIALWGPIILIGLGAATLSSAIGSVLVAPRTLQALGGDKGLPLRQGNEWLSAGVGEVNEPRNATLVTGALALVIVLLGNVNLVARLISMFFMVTYGSLCAISFLEHFAARPDYRPSFRSRWYLSLFGALICLLMMFLMDPLFAVLALLVITGLYRLVVRRQGKKDGLGVMFEGVMTQVTRYFNLRLQPRRQRHRSSEWRPSILMVNDRTFDRRAPQEFMRWLCHRHGFGTYLHYIPGLLDEQSFRESQRVKRKLVEQAQRQHSSVYVDTVVSPSKISALAQSVQIPGVSGLNNNTILFEFSTHDTIEVVRDIVNQVRFVASTRMTQAVLRHGDTYFGERETVHLWLTWNDEDNANLMILLAYVLLGHPAWANAEISVFAAYPPDRVAEQKARLEGLINEGRLPISPKNVRFLTVNSIEAYRAQVRRYSAQADLVVLGFTLDSLDERGEEVFLTHPDLHEVLYVFAPQQLKID